MYFRFMVLFCVCCLARYTFSLAVAHAAPPPKATQATKHLRSLQTILRSRPPKRTVPKRPMTRAQRRVHEQNMRQTLLRRSHRTSWQFSAQDRRVMHSLTPATTGTRLRLFEVSLQREYWVRRMIGEIWLLSHPSPPRLLGLQAQQRLRLRRLWLIAQSKYKLPSIGPYRAEHVQKLRRFLEQHGMEVILYNFLRPSERKAP